MDTDIMTFATYSTATRAGLRSGEHIQCPRGWTHARAARDGKNYEVGLKSSLFERRVYFNLTLVPHRLPRLSDVGDINSPGRHFFDVPEQCRSPAHAGCRN